MYCVVGGAVGAGPGPMRWLRFRRRKQKNTRATNDIATAAPPTTPPMMTPVRVSLTDPEPSVGVGVGAMVVELGVLVDDVDDFEGVLEELL